MLTSLKRHTFPHVVRITYPLEEIVVTFQIKIHFEGDKRVSVGNIATAVKGLG